MYGIKLTKNAKNSQVQNERNTIGTGHVQSKTISFIEHVRRSTRYTYFRKFEPSFTCMQLRILFT